jgi:hypothetical protein
MMMIMMIMMMMMMMKMILTESPSQCPIIIISIVTGNIISIIKTIGENIGLILSPTFSCIMMMMMMMKVILMIIMIPWYINGSLTAASHGSTCTQSDPTNASIQTWSAQSAMYRTLYPIDDDDDDYDDNDDDNDDDNNDDDDDDT